MQGTAELDAAVRLWQEAAEDAIAAAREAAPLSVQELGEVETSDPEDAVGRLLEAADRIVAELRAHLDEDRDARTRALALVAGSLTVVGALSTASEEPELIVEEEGLESIEQFAEPWTADVEFFAGVILPELSGSAGAASATVPALIDELSKVAGEETLALVATSIVGGGVHSVVGGLFGVLDSSVRSGAFGTLGRQLLGFASRFKRAATSVIHWIVDHALELLPTHLKDLVVDQLKEKLADTVSGRLGPLVGQGLAAICGANGLRDKWDRRPDPKPRIDPATISPFTGHIGWIKRGRKSIDRWGGRIVLVIPQAQLAYYIAVAAAVVFVVAQEWEGIGALYDAF